MAIVFSLLVSVLSVRALGETDMSPVSGIGKVCPARDPRSPLVFCMSWCADMEFRGTTALMQWSPTRYLEELAW